MMIRLACPTCGDVDLGIHEVRLEQASAGRATYHFGCPACGRHVARPASPRVLLVLRAHGVSPESPDAAPDPGAPALTPDDLLDFHLRLESIPDLDARWASEPRGVT